MPKFLRALISEPYQVREGKPGEPIRFIAATEGVKRDGLDLRMEGVQLDNFRANPVFLWSHDYMGSRLPIGRVINTQVFDGDLIADVEFDQSDDFARQVEAKYRGGFLNTVSIGWDTKKSEGLRVVEWELLDISGVNVPGDPQALIEREQAALRSLHATLGETLTKLDEGGDFERAAQDMPDADDVAESADEVEEEAGDTLAQMALLFRDFAADLSAEMAEQYRQVGELVSSLQSGDGSDEASSEGEDDEALMARVRELVAQELEAAWAQIDPDGRAGSVLSKRNRDKLETARENIDDVLEAAKPKEDGGGEDDDSRQDESQNTRSDQTDGEESDDRQNSDGNSARSNDQPDESYLLELESLFS